MTALSSSSFSETCEDNRASRMAFPEHFDPDVRIGAAEEGRPTPEDAISQQRADLGDQPLVAPMEILDKDAPSIGEVRSWLHEINPHYDPYDMRYCMNCGSCALAVYQRLSGKMDAVAGPYSLTIPEMEKATGKLQVPMSPVEIGDTLRAQGPGAFAVVGIDRAEGPGHWFCAYCPDGEHVYALDGQSGEVRGWPPDYGKVNNWDMSV